MKYIGVFFLFFSACSNKPYQLNVQNKNEMTRLVHAMNKEFQLACEQKYFLGESDLVGILKNIGIKNLQIALIGADKDKCEAKVKIHINGQEALRQESEPLVVDLPLDESTKQNFNL